METESDPGDAQSPASRAAIGKAGARAGPMGPWAVAQDPSGHFILPIFGLPSGPCHDFLGNWVCFSCWATSKPTAALCSLTSQAEPCHSSPAIHVGGTNVCIFQNHATGPRLKEALLTPWAAGANQAAQEASASGNPNVTTVASTWCKESDSSPICS